MRRRANRAGRTAVEIAKEASQRRISLFAQESVHAEALLRVEELAEEARDMAKNPYLPAHVGYTYIICRASILLQQYSTALPCI